MLRVQLKPNKRIHKTYNYITTTATIITTTTITTTTRNTINNNHYNLTIKHQISLRVFVSLSANSSYTVRGWATKLGTQIYHRPLGVPIYIRCYDIIRLPSNHLLLAFMHLDHLCGSIISFSFHDSNVLFISTKADLCIICMMSSRCLVTCKCNVTFSVYII